MLDMLFFCWWIAAQIVLESLPISSSGHIKLLEKLVPGFHDVVSVACVNGLDSCTQLYEQMMHFLHGPTLIVLAVVFFNSWFFLVVHLQRIWRLVFKLGMLTLCADVITALWYGTFAYVGVDWFPLALGFFITLLLLASLYRCPQNKFRFNYIITYMILGCIQGIALLPGISRFASTFVAARWLGFRAQRALEVSFLIQVPLIFAAFARSLVSLSNYHVWHFMFALQPLLAMIFATVISCLVLWWIKRVVINHRLWLFAWYMIIPLVIAIIVM